MNLSAVNKVTSIILLALFQIVKNADDFAHQLLEGNNNVGEVFVMETNDVSDDYEMIGNVSIDDFMFLGYDEAAFSDKLYPNCIQGRCGNCEICVSNECLPFLVDHLFNENCSVKDYCVENNACGKYDCVPTYGDYFCACPRNRYGKHCQHLWINERGVPYTGLRAIYPAAVAAGAPLQLLAIWENMVSLSKGVQFTYKTDDSNGFADESLFDLSSINAQISPYTSCRQLGFGDICNGLPSDVKYSGVIWTAEFPYLDLNYLNQSAKIQLSLPGKRNVMGYIQRFTLTLYDVQSSSRIANDYDIVVYYSQIRKFHNKCFPKRIIPNRPW